MIVLCINRGVRYGAPYWSKVSLVMEVSAADVSKACHFYALIRFVLCVLPDHNAPLIELVGIVADWRQVVDAPPLARRQTQNQRMQVTPYYALDEIR